MLALLANFGSSPLTSRSIVYISLHHVPNDLPLQSNATPGSARSAYPEDGTVRSSSSRLLDGCFFTHERNSGAGSIVSRSRFAGGELDGVVGAGNGIGRRHFGF